MKRSIVGVLACMTVVGLSVTAGAQAEAPVQADYKVVTGSSGDLVSDDAFDLQSVVSGSSLTYKRQGTLGGINLGLGHEARRLRHHQAAGRLGPGEVRRAGRH